MELSEDKLFFPWYYQGIVMKWRSMNRAFTLLELLMVIAIISLLSSIVIGNLIGARDKGNIAAGLQFDQSLKNALGSELLGEWPFNDGTGVDVSGHGHHCTINGAVASIGGIKTPAFNFGQDGDRLDCGSISLSGNQVAISWWMNMESYSGLAETDNLAPVIIDWMAGLGDYQEGTVLCYIKTNPTWSDSNFPLNSVICTYGSALTPNDVGTMSNNFIGKWHHFAFVVDATKAQMFVDGKMQYTTDGVGGVNPNGEVFSINHRNWEFGVTFDGSIDEVRVFEEALSLTEVHKLYTEGLGKIHVAQAIRE